MPSWPHTLVPAEELPSGSLLTASDSHLLALAPHTVAAVGQALAAAGIQRYVHLFVPVFPVDLSCTPLERANSPDNCAGVEQPTRAGFVLQGLFQPQRWAGLGLGVAMGHAA